MPLFLLVGYQAVVFLEEEGFSRDDLDALRDSGKRVLVSFLAPSGQRSALDLCVSELPASLSSSERARADGALAEGMQFWQGHGFQVGELACGRHDVQLDWRVDYDGEQLGFYAHRVGQERIVIYLGQSFCDDWHGFTRETVTWTIAHEIGHALGFEHDPDPRNVMHATGPAEFEEPCVVFDGSEHLSRYGSWLWRGFWIGSDAVIGYEMEEANGRGVTVCVADLDEAERWEGTGRFLAYECHESVRYVEGSVVLSPGDYALMLQCENWRGCSTTYSVTYEPA